MTLDASDFDRRIEIQSRPIGADASGDQVPQDWTLHVRVWASLRTVTGMGSVAHERAAADQLVSQATGSFRIMWREDITADMRVVTRGRVYSIAQVLYDEADREYVDLVVSTGARSS